MFIYIMIFLHIIGTDMDTFYNTHTLYLELDSDSMLVTAECSSSASVFCSSMSETNLLKFGSVLSVSQPPILMLCQLHFIYLSKTKGGISLLKCVWKKYVTLHNRKKWRWAVADKSTVCQMKKYPWPAHQGVTLQTQFFCKLSTSVSCKENKHPYTQETHSAIRCLLLMHFSSKGHSLNKHDNNLFAMK